jgi:hypothetical protein
MTDPTPVPSAETDGLREYEVWSTYKVTGTATVRARTAAEAVEKALDVTADEPVGFIFGEPWGETKMRARLITPPGLERPEPDEEPLSDDDPRYRCISCRRIVDPDLEPSAGAPLRCPDCHVDSLRDQS